MITLAPNDPVHWSSSSVDDYESTTTTTTTTTTTPSVDDNLSMHGSSSLAFVFDTTGSMYDDLVQVIDGAARILSTTLAMREKPLYNYVLVPFHDPEVGPITATTDPDKFQDDLRDLYVQGGGDCPEMSITGIKMALEASLPYSFIYVFTDARAKDYHLTDDVLSLIQQKQSQVIFVMTGDCGNASHPGFKAYEKIASTSSGQVFILEKNQVKEVLNFVRVAVQSRKVNLLSADLNGNKNASFYYDLPVDSKLKEFTISVSGENPVIFVKDPDGVTMTQENGLVTLLDLKNALIVNFKNPKRGVWNLRIDANGESTVRITGLSSLDFIHGFSKEQTFRFNDTQTRPTKGIAAYVLVNATDLPRPGRLTKLELVDLYGESLLEIPISSKDLKSSLYNISSFIPPSDFFYLKIAGFDDEGFLFQRTTPTAISPTEPKRPIVTLPPLTRGFFDKTVLLTCHVESIVPFQVQWFRNDENLGNSLFYSESSNVSWAISRVSSFSEGVYTCNATSVAGSTSSSTYLDVKDPPPIILRPRNISAFPGEDVELTCVARSTVDFNVTWLRHPEEKGRTLEDFNNGSAILKNTTREDKGRYICRAENEGGFVEEETWINILGEPEIFIDSKSSKFIVGSQLTLECRSRNSFDHQLIFRWKRNGNLLSNNNTDRLSYDEETGRLIIKETMDKDAGQWECVASNSIGQTSAFINLSSIIPPTIFINNKTVLVNVGDLAILECKADGIPVPNVTWIKDGIQLQELSFIEILPEGILKILGTQEIDAGDYDCLAVNEAGSLRETVTLEVGAPPVIIQRPQSRGVDVLKNLTLMCSAVGKPVPKVFWKKVDGKEIELHNTRMKVLDNGALFIGNVEKEDEGLYKCLAENEFGKQEVLVFITVTGIVKPLLAYGNLNVESIAGQDATLSCLVLMGNPRPIITWIKLGEPVIVSDQLIDDQNGNLILKKVKVEDEGEYICLATNSGGKSSQAIKLDVHVEPSIKDSASEFVLMENDSIRLPCEASGDPKPKITWMKNGQNIRLESDPHFYFDETGSLKIFSAQTQDSAVYSCIALNVVGRKEKRMSLFVQVPPSVDNGLNEMTVIINGTVQLECEVSGQPPPTISWMKDGRKIERDLIGSKKLHFLNNGALRIESIQMSDAGLYECFAESVAGNASKHIQLIVQVPPQFYQKAPSTVISTVGKEVLLECDVFGEPRPELIWRKNLNTIDFFDLDHKYLMNKSGTLVIPKVNISDSARYLCIAENSAGKITQEIQLIVHESPYFVRGTLSNLSVVENNRLNLPCPAKGSPIPRTRWFKEGIPITGNEIGIRLMPDGSLVLEHIQATDAGSYSCLAENIAGNSSQNVSLNVYLPPRFGNKNSDETESETSQVIEGESIQFRCLVTSSYPSPDVTWYKNGEELKETDFGERIVLHREGKELEIRRTSIEDSARYTCFARNLAGEAEKNFNLDVIVLPRINETNASDVNLSAVVNESFGINCPVSGIPSPDIVWYKDDHVIVPIDLHPHKDVRILSSGQRLEFTQVKLSNAGRYRCLARNLAGEDERIFDLNVFIPSHVEGFDVLSVIEVLVNRSAVLRCPASGHPFPDISWYHDDDFIDENGSIYVVHNRFNLHIPSVDFKDGGRYVCKAINIVGHSEKNYNLVVLAEPQINRTGMNLHPSVISNGTVTLSCPSYGIPVPDVIWLRNGDNFDVNYYPNIQLLSDGSQLAITKATIADSANYSCIVTNKAGNDSLDFLLEVQVPVSIDRSGLDLFPTVLLNHSLSLECPAVGIPSPEIVWYKNGNVISLKMNQYISIHDDGKRLEISSASAADAGLYQCRVHNDAGEDELAYHLKVIDGPEISDKTSTLINPQVVVNDTITIYCNAKGLPMPNISWSVNGQPLDRTNQRYSLSRDGHRLEIYDTEVSDTGRYSCVARNEAGVAERHFDLDVLVPPYVNSADDEVDVKVIKTKMILLECRIQGIPFPNVTWLKDAEPLATDDGRIRILLNGRHLEISMAVESDANNYVCLAMNAAGVTKMTFNVSVYVAPVFDNANIVDNPKIIANRTILLECPVSGFPLPTVTWLKDGEPLLPRPGVRFIFSGRQVEIFRAQVTDTARYTCIATNEAGELRRNYDLEVLVPPSIEGAGRTEIIDVIEGHTTYISCSTNGIPAPSIVWLKDGTPLADLSYSNTREMNSGRRLEVRHVSVKDEGLYRCQATNVAGQRAKNFRLRVLYSPRISGSHVETEVSVIEKHPIRLECNATGIPEPKLFWSKDGVLLNSSSHFRFLHGGRVLQIASSSSDDDVGVYSCNATNVAGNDMKTYLLQVLVPPLVNNSDELNEISVAVGGSITLECFIQSGSPEPIIKWSRDGSVLSIHMEPNIRVINGGQQLHIFNVQLMDIGNYDCVATNKAGNSSKDFKLNVLVPPTIEDGPTEVASILGSRTVLMCDVDGLPKPLVIWEKDGQKMEMENMVGGSGGGHMIHRTGSLQFSSVQLEDNGLYRCRATNDAGTTFRDIRLSVQVPPTIMSDGGESLKKAIVGDAVELFCNVTGTPNPRITWQKGARILSGVIGYSVALNNSLLIESVDIRDTGIYVCTAQNNAGTALTQRRLEVQVPPMIEQHISEYSVIEEREILLPCRTSGVPTPSVKWTKDNETILLDDIHYRILRSNWLAIPIVRAEDAGIFACVAENDVGMTSVEMTLVVHVPPSIEDSERVMTLTEGETAFLSCNATGFPLPDIMWIQDGRTLLLSGGRYDIHHSGTLTIKNVKRSDSGSYVCTAKNIASRTSKEYLLRVQVPPKITILPRDQEVTLNGRIDLECEAEGLPIPIIIWKVNNTDYPTSPSVNGRSRIVIDNAMKRDDGTYMCIAENEAGVRRALAGVRVKVPPKVLIHSENQAVSLSDRVMLQCPVDGGDPPSTIVWWKTEKRVQLNERMQQLSNGSLIIYDSNNDDAGEYKCVATNDAGSSEGVAFLTVERLPEFLLEPKNVTVEHGQMITFDCVASGEPQPKMTWKKERVEIQNEDRFSILPNNSLRIVASQLSDSGSYICVARNSLGSILISAQLNVQVSGHWSSWSSWSTCTVTCGQGSRSRNRKCDSPKPTNGGNSCQGQSNETRTCIPIDCPVNGGWSDWSQWEQCSQSCGLGEQIRTRECNNPSPIHGGRYCSDESTQNQQCNLRHCSVDGAWGTWSSWRHCSETCGQGLQERYRHCDSPRPEYGGHECIGIESERKICHLVDCPVDGGWSSWNEWSLCSLSCGGGSRSRMRQCNSPAPSNGGRNCLGLYTQTDYCNRDDCPVHSEWMDWSEWGGCTVTCGGGQRRRFRSCFDPTANNVGRPCIGPAQETDNCNLQNCVVDGEWSEWTEWSDCSKSCDGGIQERQRTCRRPSFGGNTCSGESIETRKCSLYPCQAGFPYQSVSNVVGNINHRDLGLSKIVANISRTNRGSKITATVTNISSTISMTFQHLISLLTPTYWTTANEMDEAINGYSLTKGNFRKDVQVEFATGEILKMNHRARGLDNEGILQVDTFANGEIPILPDLANIALLPFQEDYIQTGPGSIYGYSSRVFLVDGYVLPYAWNHSITYNPEFGKMPYLVQRMSASDINVNYNFNQQIVNYQVTTSVAKGEPSNSCPSGFILDPNEPYCKDIDECVQLTPCSHSCVNTPGSFMCSCPPGMSLAANGRICRDIDECEQNLSDCQKSQECLNTIGSFRCLPRCEQGHRRNLISLLCEDINECLEKSIKGLCDQECVNVVGSYRCACKQGFRLSGRSHCNDINECQELTHRCSQFCINSMGGYLCSCHPGYHLKDTYLCFDVDECVDGLHDCPLGEECQNSEGGYSCLSSCPNGFSKTSNGSCVDVDECSLGNSLCQYNQICSNSVGSYSCVCPRGYRLDGHDLSSCLDIDECQSQSHCQHECMNTLGSFQCTCPKGYILTANGRTCQDIDECQDMKINCGRDKRCFNRRGDFECVDISCPLGYQRDSESGYCIIDCSDSASRCPSGTMHKEILEFHMVSLPSGIQANQDLVRLLVRDQNNVHLNRSVFAIVDQSNDDEVPFDIRTEDGKGVVHTLTALDEKKSYQMKVEGVAYDPNGTVVLYHTTFIIFISVSSYPY